MIVYPLKSRLAKPGDSILALLCQALSTKRLRLKTNDIIAVSSKIIAISEDRVRDLVSVKVTRDAKAIAGRFFLPPSFAQIVLDEADSVIGGVKGALLTIKNGDAVPNAGVDRKNAPKNSVVLWPGNPDATARNLRNKIEKKFGKSVSVIIVDSRVTPMRLGTIGFAIGSSGFRPIEDLRGRSDLSRRRIEITVRAIADGLAATAQLVMGESTERTPFVVIRDASVPKDSNAGISDTRLTQDQCLYMSQLPVGFSGSS